MLASFIGCGVIAFIAVLGMVLGYHSTWLYRLGRKETRKLTYLEEKLMAKDFWYWVPFLCTPFLFAVQQGCEGVVWIRVNNGGDTAAPGTAFSFFAYAFWPLWVPLIALVLEARPKARSRYAWKIRMFAIAVLLACGTALFAYLFSSMTYNGLYATEGNDHIVYHFSMFGDPSNFASIVPYLGCTVLPFLLAWSVVAHWVLSLVVAVSAGIAYALYASENFPSVWCFFAAWLSLLMIAIRIAAIRRWECTPPPAPPPSDQTVVELQEMDEVRDVEI